MVPQRDNESWKRARLAKNKLEQTILDHPAVTMIDLGHLSGESGSGDDEIVLRVHVGGQRFKTLANKPLPFPDEVDGFRVILVSGDYEIE